MVAQNNGSHAVGAAVGFAGRGLHWPLQRYRGGADNSPVVAVALETSVLTPDLDTANWIKM